MCIDPACMQKEIENHIKGIQDTIIAAMHNHDIWWIYKNRDTRQQYIDVMNAYLGFFQTSIHAHFVAMIIALYRLYETRRDTISFPQLLRLLEFNQSLSSDAQVQIERLMQEAKPIWIKIGTIRSAVFAHLSNEREIGESFTKADLKYRHVKDLIELSKTIINTITRDYSRSTEAFNLSAESDTITLLTDLSGIRKG